jgi:hypothetical protein
MKARKPQEYSAKEFDAVVALIRQDESLREDIEAITGQKLDDGKSPRELFDLFLTLEGATQVQAVVVRYGQARRAVRQTRIELAAPDMLPPSTAEYVAGVQSRLDAEKRRREAAEAELKVLRSRNVLQLPAGKAANG